MHRRKRAGFVYRKQSAASESLDAGKLFPASNPIYMHKFPQPALSDRVMSGTTPSAGNPPLLLYPHLLNREVAPSHLLRKRLRQIAELNVALTWVISGLGYGVVAVEEGKDVLKYAICGISAVQLGLVVLYSSKWCSWRESVRQELRLSPVPVPTMSDSKRALTLCVLECCFHLIVLPPKFFLQWQLSMLGTYSFLSLDDFLYALILLRNYHCLRYLFWRSALSTRRTCMVTTLTNVRLTLSFMLKYCLTVYSLVFISGIYVVVMVLSGILVHVFEKDTPGTGFDTFANALWLVAQTQVTVGYGDFTPRTYLSCSVVIISCFVGSFLLSLIVSLLSRQMTLSLAESSLYTNVAYAGKKRRKLTEAVVFLQSWWRLMHMRLHRNMQARTVIDFYSQQGRFKGVLQTCQQAKDRRFEWQIEAFQGSVSTQCRHMTEYLQPVLHSKELVSSTQAVDLLRAYYHLMHQSKDLTRMLRKHRHAKPHVTINGAPVQAFQRSPRFSRSVYAEHRPPSPLNHTRGLAKAKVQAHQHLIGRLLRNTSQSREFELSRTPSPTYSLSSN